MNKNSLSLIELAQKVQDLAEKKRDFVADTREVGFVSTNTQKNAQGDDVAASALVLNSETYPVTEHAHRQIAAHTNVPMKYYNIMREEAPELLDRNVNHWFQEKASPRMIRTLEGNARAFLSNRYRRVDNEQIAEAALRTILEKSHGIDVVSTQVTDNKMYIQARWPRLVSEVKQGDPVQAGFVISNSEIGAGAISIQPMVYRLVCLNGMVRPMKISEGALRRNHVGRAINGDEENFEVYSDETVEADDKALMLKIRDSIMALSDPELFTKLMEEMKRSANTKPVEEPVKAVEELAKAYQLPQKESNSVLESLIRGGDYSQWGMVNAVTSVANTIDDYDRAVELEHLGGRVLSLNPTEWERIAVPVAA